MKFVDRILTIVITATITSAIWIVAGGTLIENADSVGQRNTTRPAEAAPSPVQSMTVSDLPEVDAEETSQAVSLDTSDVAAPQRDVPGTLQIPVLNIRPSDLTDTYRDSRSGSERLHEAIDIMAPEGTSVVSAAPGRIERLFKSETGGNTIFIRSVDGETIYYYAHLKEYAEGLKEGQRVRRGQRLGSVGSTGNASEESPHLHFAILQTTEDAEWWEPANAVNPYPILMNR